MTPTPFTFLLPVAKNRFYLLFSVVALAAVLRVVRAYQ